MKSGISIGFALALLTSAGVQASGINGINGGMPNRISMNVTVAKQTQGATFGEKVNAGLRAARSRKVLRCRSRSSVDRMPAGSCCRMGMAISPT